jgi:hypothetical protein
VAQLGARFHGMEEVVGSNPTRSTKFFLEKLSAADALTSHGADCGKLRTDLDWGSVRDGSPNLIHLFIGDRDTSVSPVSEPV